MKALEGTIKFPLYDLRSKNPGGVLLRPRHQPGETIRLFNPLVTLWKLWNDPEERGSISRYSRTMKRSHRERAGPASRPAMPAAATRGQCVLRASSERQYLQPRKSLKDYLLQNWPNNYTPQLFLQSLNFLGYDLLFLKSVVLILKTTVRKNIKILSSSAPLETNTTV